jgi:N-acetylneuraminic acid mutarotase
MAVEIRIYNDRGDEIFAQVTTASKDRQLYDKLIDFYIAARSSYYKADETIESLLKEANEPGILGNPAPF